MMHYVQFFLGSAHADWMVEILEFDGAMQMWMICMLVFLYLLEWKPLVKMKMVGDLSLGIKVWDKLFYLPGESGAGASWFFFLGDYFGVHERRLNSFFGGFLYWSLAWSLVSRHGLENWCLL